MQSVQPLPQSCDCTINLCSHANMPVSSSSSVVRASDTESENPGSTPGGVFVVVVFYMNSILLQSGGYGAELSQRSYKFD